MKRSLLLLALSLLLWPTPGHSFCGFYVAAGNAKLFNRSSQVVMVRDQDRTVLTMANDFQGEPKEFAIVVPVPTVLEKGQIHVGDQAAIDHLEAFTAPRLVEYFDESPCAMREQAMDRANYGQLKSMAAGAPKPASPRGVTILAQYTVGEYDILILGQGEPRPRDLAHRAPLSHPRRRLARAQRVHQAGHEVLRRQGEPEGTAEARVPAPASDPDRLRVAQVHAADPPRDGERQRAAGALRLRAHPAGPRRGDQLPHGEGPVRRRRAALRQGPVRGLLPRGVRPPGEAAGHERRVHRVRLGHGLVRPVRVAAALEPTS